MARKFKQGDEVVQIMPAPIKGKVLGFSLDQVEGDVHVTVGYTDEDGEEHTRDFLESALEKAPEETKK